MAIVSARKKRKKGLVDDDAPAADMLAFASVMTILLAFFIMLSSYAGRPKEDAANEVIQSLQEAFGNFGMTKVVFGRSDSVSNMNFKLDRFGGKYNVVNPWHTDTSVNTIDKKFEIEYMRKGHQVVFPTEINFINGGMELSPESKFYLNNLIKMIRNRDCKVTVGGYTGEDFIPSDDYPTSWQLSAKYASAVTKYFNDVGNIDYKRLTAIGYGKYRPLLGEESSFNTKTNNRINIIISDK